MANSEKPAAWVPPIDRPSWYKRSTADWRKIARPWIIDTGQYGLRRLIRRAPSEQDARRAIEVWLSGGSGMNEQRFLKEWGDGL